MTTYIDPILKDKNIEVEPEELLEPDWELPKTKGKPLTGLRGRLLNYGNRVLASGSKFGHSTIEAVRNVATALAGSIILLPVVIIVRGVWVLSRNLVDWVKGVILSIIRLFFEVLNAIVSPVRIVFGNFNKHVLFPLLKHIREDDTAAVIALVVFLAITGGIVYLLSLVF